VEFFMGLGAAYKYSTVKQWKNSEINN
jgi:hypothetical protein